jgi:transposase-like protein
MPRIKKSFPDPNSLDGQILARISQALYNKEPLSGPNGIITKLLKQAMETTLEAEIDNHISAFIHRRRSKTLSSQPIFSNNCCLT